MSSDSYDQMKKGERFVYEDAQALDELVLTHYARKLCTAAARMIVRTCVLRAIARTIWLIPH